MRRRPNLCLFLRCRRSLTTFPCLVFYLLVYGGIIALLVLAYAKLNVMPAIKNFLAGEIVDFTDADNETGFPELIVPNLVHFIKFGGNKLTFIQMLCMRAVLVNHRPDRIMVHCSDCTNGTLEGKYWDMLHDTKPWFAPPRLPHDIAATQPTPWPPIVVQQFQQPTYIFGKKFGNVYHAADVARIRVLMRYGGIALDFDTFVVQSLDRFRHFEFALGWDFDRFMGTQIFVAHRNARFLKLYLNSYRWYLPNQWYYNAGQLPTKGILEKQPHLVHRVPELFGVRYLINELYKDDLPEWRDYYAIHLLINHRRYRDEESPIKDFDEENIKTYNCTFGRMARMVFYGTEDFVQ